MDMRHVIDLLTRAELYDEAAAVGLVMQQRAELLDLLKCVKDAYDFSGELSAQTMRKIEAAITKAEAAE